MILVCHLKAKIPHAHGLCSLQWFMRYREEQLYICRAQAIQPQNNAQEDNREALCVVTSMSVNVGA